MGALLVKVMMVLTMKATALPTASVRGLSDGSEDMPDNCFLRLLQAPAEF